MRALQGTPWLALCWWGLTSVFHHLPSFHFCRGRNNDNQTNTTNQQVPAPGEEGVERPPRLQAGPGSAGSGSGHQGGVSDAH